LVSSTLGMSSSEKLTTSRALGLLIAERRSTCISGDVADEGSPSIPMRRSVSTSSASASVSTNSLARASDESASSSKRRSGTHAQSAARSRSVSSNGPVSAGSPIA
jgi:hypothetical protein